MKFKKQIITLLSLFLFLGIGLNAYAALGVYNLSLEAIADGGATPQVDFIRGDVFYLHVIIDNTTKVAGTAQRDEG